MREQDAANAHGAPEIDTVEEEIVLPKGASWNFTCKSAQPILWKSYAASFHWVSRKQSPFEDDRFLLLIHCVVAAAVVAIILFFFRNHLTCTLWTLKRTIPTNRTEAC